MSYYCDLCQKKRSTEMKFGIDLCDECYKGFEDVLKDERLAIVKYSNPKNFPLATPQAHREIISLAQQKYRNSYGDNFIGDSELKKQNYAKSFQEFYEYNVVTIATEKRGQVDPALITKALADHAKQGWKLHTVYSVNSESVLIFERRIEKID